MPFLSLSLLNLFEWLNNVVKSTSNCLTQSYIKDRVYDVEVPYSLAIWFCSFYSGSLRLTPAIKTVQCLSAIIFYTTKHSFIYIAVVIIPVHVSYVLILPFFLPSKNFWLIICTKIWSNFLSLQKKRACEFKC